MGKKLNLVSLEEALRADREKTREWHREYANTSLVSLLSLLDFDKRYVKAEGVKVWDVAGREYLDFLGGYGSLNLGHNHPRVWEAVEKVKGSPTILQATLSPLVGALAKNLAIITPGDLRHSFFCNSGAEAVEGALKTARLATGRTGIVYAENSFHGKTMGALSVTGRHKYQKPFEPLIPNCRAVPFGDLKALEEELKKGDVATFIVEPIQGEGGVTIPPTGYLKEAEGLCRKHQVLFIVDEIQTGFGRTGRMFACEYEEVEPDMMCLSKSLGGGLLPIGAFVVKEKVWKKAYGGMNSCLLHTTTFGGNLLSCAAALAAIEVLVEEDLPAKAKEKGTDFLAKLKVLEEKYAMIKEVRGKGLMIGVEFAEPTKGWFKKLSAGLINKLSQEYFASLVASELLNEHGIITAYTLNNPNVIRLQPPLVVTEEELDKLVEALEEICRKYKGFARVAVKTGKEVVSGFIFSRGKQKH
jgi:putrescine aminotransferase